jgi:hypothetical protein
MFYAVTHNTHFPMENIFYDKMRQDVRILSYSTIVVYLMNCSKKKKTMRMTSCLFETKFTCSYQNCSMTISLTCGSMLQTLKVSSSFGCPQNQGRNFFFKMIKIIFSITKASQANPSPDIVALLELEATKDDPIFSVAKKPEFSVAPESWNDKTSAMHKYCDS